MHVHSQRAGAAESPAERSTLNGPLRAQSTEETLSILRRTAYVNC